MSKDTTPTSGAADLPEALRSIQRFEVVDCIDDKHVPAVIPKPHGPWVRYEDHIAALAAGQATAPQGVAYAALPEPLEIDWPELHSQALGCGVEDRGLHNRYECAEYGWQDGVDKCAERVPEQIFDADQMRAFADATHALRASHGQAPAETGNSVSAQADSVQEDAARYRWLRRWKGQEHEPPFTVQHEIDGTLWGGDLDAAIDTARKQGANHD